MLKPTLRRVYCFECIKSINHRANDTSESFDQCFVSLDFKFNPYFVHNSFNQTSNKFCHICNTGKKTIERKKTELKFELLIFVLNRITQSVYVSGGGQNESFDNDNNEGDVNIIRIRGLPWNTTKQEICDFFDGVNIVNGENGIHWVTLATNHTKPLSEAYIELASYDDFQRAQSFHKKNLGTRYIEGKRKLRRRFSCLHICSNQMNWKIHSKRYRCV